jgi:hypothetical protein
MLKVVYYYLTWAGYTRRGGRILIWLAAASNRLSRTTFKGLQAFYLGRKHEELPFRISILVRSIKKN